MHSVDSHFRRAAKIQCAETFLCIPRLTSGGAMRDYAWARIAAIMRAHFRAPPPEVANFSEKPFAIVIST